MEAVQIGFGVSSTDLKIRGPQRSVSWQKRFPSHPKDNVNTLRCFYGFSFPVTFFEDPQSECNYCRRPLAVSYWGAASLESQTSRVCDKHGNKGNQWQAHYCLILCSHLPPQYVHCLAFHSPCRSPSPVEARAFSTAHLGKSSWKRTRLHTLSCSGGGHYGEPIQRHCRKYHLCADDSRKRRVSSSSPGHAQGHADLSKICLFNLVTFIAAWYPRKFSAISLSRTYHLFILLIKN